MNWTLLLFPYIAGGIGGAVIVHVHEPGACVFLAAILVGLAHTEGGAR